jgi:DNA excision repair protein ERCC-2
MSPASLFTNVCIPKVWAMNLFPYKPRKNQTAVMQTIKRTLIDRQNLVFESGTGSGKTICTLAATLEYALENNKKIIYTTRTNAQQRQVILELREIRKKNKKLSDQIFGVGMQGRSNMCILARNDPEFSKGNAEELSKLCTSEKKKAKTNDKDKGCIYYRNFLDKEKAEKTSDWFRKILPTAEEFIEYCENKKICPYEINKILMRESRLVVVPYIYVFDLMIRNMLFDCLSVPEDDMILVVDEAHNLPDYIRDLYSAQLSMYMLNSCIFEAEKYGDPSMVDGRSSVSEFCKILIEIVNDLRDTYVYGILENGIRTGAVKNNDAFIPSHELETEILSRLKITSKTLHDIIGDLTAYGEKIQEYRQKDGKLPRSYLHKLGLFLDFWISLEMDQYSKLIVDASVGKNPRIEAFCLDPSVGTDILRDFHSSIHMSGTLEPLEEYRDSMGLSDKTELISYPSPFPIENRKIFFVRDVTTKYDEVLKDDKIIERMMNHVTNVCNSFPKNTMVFFPSFNIMSMFRHNEEICKINRCIYFEEQEMSQMALMDLVSDFKEQGNGEGSGAALFSVMGGRISEGMDFPAEQLEIAMIVGIPYPKPTARQRGLQRYYDLKFRKGWEYTVEAPTARKLLQSIGRLIRDEKDRGVAVILDRRAPRFKKYISDLVESKNLIDDIDTFIGI